ncbi:uncharacterized protein UMAG_12338 [Mycosarcoma maydis]|uniref:Uncharacterized protein n=1 Tax=Mycosarcoma maydis TaxID=5270 RepID=A0A0D1DNQ6_MYCMD|nr:uncharacterized protein UMAG_12338 [Ustilago maydis 521]KIS65681.1 hypothetical protein UMAG_12338 [Ustilago maydis 521]|eukprot:XP_011392761.1 hypothetical protein UMAG_12338 [Ustilago maydis 521]
MFWRLIPIGNRTSNKLRHDTLLDCNNNLEPLIEQGASVDFLFIQQRVPAAIAKLSDRAPQYNADVTRGSRETLNPKAPSYLASALYGLSRDLALGLAHRGIRANAIARGRVPTELRNGLAQPHTSHLLKSIGDILLAGRMHTYTCDRPSM